MKKLSGWVFIAAALLMLGSIIGVALIGFPTEDKTEKVIASYEQTGGFTLESYDSPQSFGDTIFPPITDKMTINFVYVFAKDAADKNGLSEKTVSVKAVLSESFGKWEKDIPLIGEKKYRTDKVEISFPLDFEAILAIGSNIEKDLNPRYNPQVSFYEDGTYRLDIIATITDGTKNFTASIGGKLNASSFEMDTPLNGARRGKGYWELYSFGYEALLRENALLSASKISKEATAKKPEPAKETSLSVVQAINPADVTFHYNLSSDKTIENLKAIGTIEVIGESPERWQKTLITEDVLLDSENGEIIFPVNLDYVKAAVSASDLSDGRTSSSVDLKVRAKLSLKAVIGENEVSDEFLSETLTGRIEGGKIIWSIGPDTAKTGGIKETGKERPKWMTGFSSALVVVFVISGGMILTQLYLRKKAKSGFAKEQAKTMGKYDKNLFSKAEEDITASWKGEKQQESSLTALIRAATNDMTGIHFYEDLFKCRVVYWAYGLKVLYWFTAEGK
ncbi:MAG: hypothetical protein WC519_02750 [Parcubacteria group bacterium]